MGQARKRRGSYLRESDSPWSPPSPGRCDDHTEPLPSVSDPTFVPDVTRSRRRWTRVRSATGCGRRPSGVATRMQPNLWLRSVTAGHLRAIEGRRSCGSWSPPAPAVTGGQACRLAHNPKVVGSNPTPATNVSPGQRPFSGSGGRPLLVPRARLSRFCHGAACRALRARTRRSLLRPRCDARAIAPPIKRPSLVPIGRLQ
jgi:hypothetical protein